MDYFENIVATLLEADGYWVKRSFKVNLTKQEKKEIGKPSIPRPEIDLLALCLARNEIIAFEAKSFLDSPGISAADLAETYEVPSGRYKLFTCEKYREIVLKRLKQDLESAGMANQKTTIKLGLAAGKSLQNDSEKINDFMQEREWIYWSPIEIKSRVSALADRGYENDPAIITAKILLR